MGHEFFSVEYVPDNYDNLVRQMEADKKAYHKAKNKKISRSVHHSLQDQKKARDSIFKDARKEGLIKLKRGYGQKLIKLAGRPDYYAEVFDDRFKAYRKRICKEKRERKDAYLKGKLLAWYKDPLQNYSTKKEDD
jgi:hypothetical protein